MDRYLALNLMKLKPTVGSKPVSNLHLIIIISSIWNQSISPEIDWHIKALTSAFPQLFAGSRLSVEGYLVLNVKAAIKLVN